MFEIEADEKDQAIRLIFQGKIDAKDVIPKFPKLLSAFTQVHEGYTLIEDFKGGVTLDKTALRPIARMLEVAAEHKIELVARVLPLNSVDPGISIFHRTRWKNPPREVECLCLKEACALAHENITDHCE